jgi:hypothetical protein
VINWVKQTSSNLPNAPEASEIPEVALRRWTRNFCGLKKTLIWLWTAVNKASAGILAWVLIPIL